jgi:hypothetical protein
MAHRVTFSKPHFLRLGYASGRDVQAGEEVTLTDEQYARIEGSEVIAAARQIRVKDQDAEAPGPMEVTRDYAAPNQGEPVQQKQASRKGRPRAQRR